jgi:hypothetical protein
MWIGRNLQWPEVLDWLSKPKIFWFISFVDLKKQAVKNMGYSWGINSQK